jgi:tetratricopeptide (TPR) repeat protein
LDNNFAPAHAQLAIATSLLGSYGELSLEEVRRKAIPHLDRAQELEPDLADAHAGRALLARFASDPQSAIEYARKALALNPNHADAMFWLMYSLSDMGRYEEAFAALKQMLMIDPLTGVGRSNYITWLGAMGRIEEAHQLADQLLTQHPGFGYLDHAFTSLIFEGKIAEALSWALRGQAEVPTDYTARLRVLGFIWVGEYDEARRVDNDLTFVVDIAEGRFEEAIQATQRDMQLNPDSGRAAAYAAIVLYLAGRIDEALPLFERLLDFVPEGRPLFRLYEMNIPGQEMTMRLALARRKTGDEDGAQAAAQIVRQDLSELTRVGIRNTPGVYQTQAMIAAFENDPERVFAALKSAIQRGLRNPQVFDDPIYEGLWDNPRFVALQQELDVIRAAEHDKVLQLICFNNPTPENWQPLPETCEGAEEQREL